MLRLYIVCEALLLNFYFDVQHKSWPVMPIVSSINASMDHDHHGGYFGAANGANAK